ncbi:MAG: hypothetical protein ACI9FJ_002015 [Alteromonadaceae bacterium]|jgi:hypothetical protein
MSPNPICPSPNRYISEVSGFAIGNNKAVLNWFVEALYQDSQGKTAILAYLIDANSGVVLQHWNSLPELNLDGDLMSDFWESRHGETLCRVLI